VGCLVGLVYLPFRGPVGPGLVLTGAATTAAVWWGPASRRLRSPTRYLVRRLTGPVTGWCAVAVVTIAAGACAYALVTGGVVWQPADGSPWRPGTLLGSILSWL